MIDDVEILLKHMPLKKPPQTLDARVLAYPLRQRRVRLWTVAGGSVAAAAAALLLWVTFGSLPTRPDVPTGPGPEAVALAPAVPQGPPGIPLTLAGNAAPVRLEKNLTHLRYEGVVASDDRTPLMQFRRQRLDQIEVIDRAGGRRMEMSVPREDVILVKAPVY